jgi:hypothetical protein
MMRKIVGDNINNTDLVEIDIYYMAIDDHSPPLSLYV